MILTTGGRLAVAAALCALPLGAPPGHRDLVATVAITRFTGLDVVFVGTPRATTLLVVAAVVLAWCAIRRRTPATRRAARAATLTIGLAAAFAASRGASVTFACAALALILVVPPVWRPRGVFVPGAADR